jgi:hypothetical protein
MDRDGLYNLSLTCLNQRLKEALEFGNHKSTVQQQDLLKKLVTEDILQGFALTLPLDKIASIPGAQNTIKNAASIKSSTMYLTTLILCQISLKYMF